MSGPSGVPIHTRPNPIYLLLAAGLGLVIGVFIGAVFIKPAGSSPEASVAQAQSAQNAAFVAAFKPVSDESLWRPAPLVWNRLGPFAKAGRAPKTFSIPSKMYDYGAVTDPIAPSLVTEDIILRVDIADPKGVIGVSLVNPAGDPLVSEEQTITNDDGNRSVLFLLRAKDLPASVLLRNFGDASGKKGSITVANVSYAPVKSFTAQQMAAIEKVGLNRGVK